LTFHQNVIDLKVFIHCHYAALAMRIFVYTYLFSVNAEMRLIRKSNQTNVTLADLSQPSSYSINVCQHCSYSTFVRQTIPYYSQRLVGVDDIVTRRRRI